MSSDTEYVRGAERLKQRIATVRKNLDLPDLTFEIGSLLWRRTKQRFEDEVDPDGNPWKPLADNTLRIKRRLGYGNKKKLQRSEALKNAIRIIRGGAGSTFTNTGAGVRIGVQDPKLAPIAKALNQGTPTIPARRFLGIGRLDVKAVDSLMRRKAAQLERS